MVLDPRHERHCVEIQHSPDQKKRLADVFGAVAGVGAGAYMRKIYCLAACSDVFVQMSWPLCDYKLGRPQEAISRCGRGNRVTGSAKGKNSKQP